MKYWDEKSKKLLTEEELKRAAQEAPVDDADVGETNEAPVDDSTSATNDKEASEEKKAIKSKK